MLKFYSQCVLTLSSTTHLRHKTTFSNCTQIPRRLAPFDRPPFDDRFETPEEKFFVSCCPGMEQVAAKELENPLIFAKKIQPKTAGVSFRGENLRAGYAAALWLRTAQRVLHVVHHGKLPTNRPASQTIPEFFNGIQNFEKFLGPHQSFSVRSSVWGSTTVKDNHTVNQLVKQAVVQLMQRKGFLRPVIVGIGSGLVDVPFYLTVYRNHILLYRDLTGPFLNSRGYKRVQHPAALTESQAAGLLYLTGWDKLSQKENSIFVDPMCGAGILLCEAGLMAMNCAPGLLRSSWAFTQWLDFDSNLWTELLHEARSMINSQWKGHVLGCDIHPIAVELSKESRKVVSMEKVITIVNGNCKDWKLKVHPDLIVVNPPWAIKKRQEMPPINLIPTLKQSWKELGHFLWNSCKGSKVYFPCNHPFLYRQLGLHVTERSPLWLGGTQLGFYGVHLHNTEAINKHKRRGVPIDLEPRTREERKSEINHVLQELNVQKSEEKTLEESSDKEWKVEYSWKLKRYRSQSKTSQNKTKQNTLQP